MDPATWTEIKDIFAAALAAPPPDREKLLDERCAGRAALRIEVAALLSSHELASSFMEKPAVASAAWLLDSPPRAVEGHRVGPFRLAARLGAGGMGIVYRAERVDGGFDQQVAIKIIDSTLHDAEALSRFRIERQILASLTHPNIVSFIDGGLTDGGQAFLVMELVDGVRVNEFCRDRRLALDARLQLVEEICRAVQYAHQHGVVHRDLKPGNILVTAEGVPKVLDFGVSKLVSANGEGDATATGLLRPLTPDYASPEQLRGLPVTTSSDIYALGVLLYELVAGHRPYETSGQTLDRVLEIVTTQDPPKPSLTLDRAPEPLPYEAGRVRGDLDAIVMKAMRKDPAQRYGSPQELSSDLARYRASEPVVAREPSFAYLLRKAVRRHRAAAFAAAVSAVALIAALGISLWQTRRTAIARDRAEARFSDARQLANALIFKVHDGIAPLPGATPVRKMIVAEALTYLERLSQDPSVDDGLRLELASAYQRIGDVQGNPGGANLGDRKGALASYDRAAALLAPLVSKPSADRTLVYRMAMVELDQADTLNAVGDKARAVEVVRSALARADGLERGRPGDHQARSLLARGHFSLAVLTGAPDALPHWKKSAELYEGLLAEQPDSAERQRNVALASKYLGAQYQFAGDLAAARTHYARALELDERRLAAQPLSRNAMFDVAIDIGNVAGIDQSMGRLTEAAAGFERSLALRQKLSALDPQDISARSRVAYMHNRLASFYFAVKRYSDSLSNARKAVEIMEPLAATARDQRIDLASFLMSLGQIEMTSNRASACKALRRSSTIADEVAKSGELRSADSPLLRGLQEGLPAELAKCKGA